MVISKRKKRSSPQIDLVFPTFRPDFIITSKNICSEMKLYVLFSRGAPKKKGAPEATASFASPNIHTMLFRILDFQALGDMILAIMISHLGELKVFFATCIMVGIVRKPDVMMYWSRNSMVETPLFSKTISRDRCRKLRKNLHFRYNTLDDESDRLFKIKPLLDAFLGLFRTTYLPAKHISVDESFLKFHGKLRWKKYNPSKGHVLG